MTQVEGRDARQMARFTEVFTRAAREIHAAMGLEESLEAIVRSAAIPVIAVSAAGKRPDADVQFRKPLDFEKFLSAVRKYVRPARA